MFKKGDKVKYKNYEAEIVYEYADGYTVRFKRGRIIVDRFCYADELKAVNTQISLFNL